MEDSGFNTEMLVQYYVFKDRIGNLELLLSHENQEKSSQPFEQWISTRDSSFKQRHLISDDPELWKLQNFEHFIKRREKMIEDRLKQLFGPPDKEE